ncbi:unnamed protein product [Amoebophrya sp. A120]|nr:unnamed protein product [Amoebophrya sp. A120]|eukprot:GSA120T00002455001.1
MSSQSVKRNSGSGSSRTLRETRSKAATKLETSTLSLPIYAHQPWDPFSVRQREKDVRSVFARSVRWWTVCSFIPCWIAIFVNGYLARVRHPWMISAPISLSSHETWHGRWLATMGFTFTALLYALVVAPKAFWRFLELVDIDQDTTAAEEINPQMTDEIGEDETAGKKITRRSSTSSTKRKSSPKNRRRSRTPAASTASSASNRRRSDVTNASTTTSTSKGAEAGPNFISGSRGASGAMQVAAYLVADVLTVCYCLLLPLPIFAQNSKERAWTTRSERRQFFWEKVLCNASELAALVCAGMQISCAGLCWQSWWPVQENRIVDTEWTELEWTTLIHRFGTTPLFLGGYLFILGAIHWVFNVSARKVQAAVWRKSAKSTFGLQCVLYALVLNVIYVLGLRLGFVAFGEPSKYTFLNLMGISQYIAVLCFNAAAFSLAEILS